MFAHKTGLVYVLLVVLVTLVFVVSLFVGHYTFSLEQVFALISGVGVEQLSDGDKRVFFQVRFPRLLAAMLIGAALSVSGATYQSTFKNPLVSPDILGAAAGASFGASLAIVLGLGMVYLLLLAFFFGLVGVLIAYGVGLKFASRERDNTVTLVLCGMVITAVFSALISGIKLVADPYDELPAITFWLMGSLANVTSDQIWIMLAPLVVGFVVLFCMRHRLNVLALSDEEVEALGINAKVNRGLVILCATLLTSSSVAVGGMIPWVGLIVPHIARLLIGPNNAKLIPVSFLCGMAFLMIIDDVCRTILTTDLPLGILAALVGAPLFLVLLSRSGKGAA